MNDYLFIRKGSGEKRIALSNFFSGANSSADGSVLPVSTASEIYNFDFSSGALTHGYGLEGGIFQRQDITSAWVYRRYDFDISAYVSYIMFSDFSGKVYYFPETESSNSAKALNGVVFSSVPFAVCYRLYGEDVILMCGANEGMYVWNGKDAAYLVEDAPKITSLCMHYERLFVTVGQEANSVRFSDDLDPTNWGTDLTEGGFIQLLDERGRLNKVLSFLNYVYIFRDYGISRLTAFADQSEFSAANLYVSSGKIEPGSVTVCGDTVLFFAGDGLYRFDGAGTVKLLPKLEGLIGTAEGKSAAYHNGKYYAAVVINKSGGRENGLLVYDVKTGGHSLSCGLDIKNFAVVNDELYCILESGKTGIVAKCGALFGVPLIKTWRGGMLDFGTEKVKRIKEFYADSDDSFTLTLFTECGEKEFKLTPKNGIVKQKINFSGRKLGFQVKAETAAARISRPGFIMSVLK